MDLNTTDLLFHRKGQFVGSCEETGRISNCSQNINFRDTALKLNCFSCEMSETNRNISPGNQGCNQTSHFDDGCRLVLGLGSMPSLNCDGYYPIMVDKNKDSTKVHGRQFRPDNLEGSSSILSLGLSRGFFETEGMGVGSNSVHLITGCQTENQPTKNEKGLQIPIFDEGSTSARKSGGYMPSLLLAPRLEINSEFTETQKLFELGTNSYHPQCSPEPSASTDCSVSSRSTGPAASVGFSDDRSYYPKKCRFRGCGKGARGALGLCIAHGGGQRCQKLGCNKGAESRTAYCKAHGGGHRCQRLGCTKSAEGKTDYCIRHGGGRRCGHPGCTKAARGKSGLCIRHGGGKRCTAEGCMRSAEGQAGLCISHGGGRRCQYPQCGKGAQGSTMFCKAHGGGKRCVFAGCTKGAEGSTPLCKGHGGGKRCLFDGGGICPKSVHGGTDYCVAHGGGKRCTIPGCTKSARGRTDCCVKHGGGKRCQFESCGKSAQGSTDFCKAHGGGKRCTWGQEREGPRCEKFARGKSGLCAAHGNLTQQGKVAPGSGSTAGIGPGLFRRLVVVSPMGSSGDNYSSEASAISDCIESPEKAGKRRLIPPQVLVPMSMKSSSGLPNLQEEESSKRFNFLVPEGRVHGGGLMSLLGGNLKGGNGSDGV